MVGIQLDHDEYEVRVNQPNVFMFLAETAPLPVFVTSRSCAGVCPGARPAGGIVCACAYSSHSGLGVPYFEKSIFGNAIYYLGCERSFGMQSILDFLRASGRSRTDCGEERYLGYRHNEYGRGCQGGYTDILGVIQIYINLGKTSRTNQAGIRLYI